MARWALLVALTHARGAAGVAINKTLRNEDSAASVSQSFSKATSNSGRAAIVGVEVLSDAALGRKVASLKEVAQDLQQDEVQEEADVKGFDKQIVALVRKRDAEKKQEARKARELAFLHAEVKRLEAKLAARHGGSAAAASAAADAADAAATATSAAASSATEDVDAAAAAGESSGAAVGDAAAAGDASQAAAASTAAGAQQAGETGDLNEAEAVVAEAEAAAGSAGTARTAQGVAHGAAAASAEGAGARLRRAQSVASDSAGSASRAAASAAAASSAAAANAAAASVAASQQQATVARVQTQAHSEAQAQSAEELEHEQNRRQAEQVADSADDSFKQFMKEEDGEDQMGDTDYEDSANALAGAIGWNRNDIEHKADDAVKQLTEAIGGKKVIQSVQGMMAGVR